MNTNHGTPTEPNTAPEEPQTHPEGDAVEHTDRTEHEHTERVERDGDRDNGGDEGGE